MKYSILLSRRSAVDDALSAIAKRASKKGLEGFVRWSWGAVTRQLNENAVRRCYADSRTQVELDAKIAETLAAAIANYDSWGESVLVERIALTLEVETPKLPCDWSLVARLDHSPEGNILRSVPGVECPETYRMAKAWCDHCKRVRSRKDTFVLSKAMDGALVYAQVGSSCIADFLGHDGEAEKIACMGQYLSEISACTDDAWEGGGGGYSDWSTESFVPVVAALIRRDGWLSSTTAREQGRGGTSSRAWAILENRMVINQKTGERLELNPKDLEDAATALTWAKALPVDSTGYLGNLRVLACRGYVSARDAGIIGSVLVAYAHDQAREVKRQFEARESAASKYVGQVKERISLTVTVTKLVSIETAYGPGTIVLMRDQDGNIFKWKTGDIDLEVDATYTGKGTVKAHVEYKGILQTELTRCSLERVTEVKAA